MAFIIWDQEDDRVVDVRQEDGPGDYTDDPSTSAVEQVVSKESMLDEYTIASVVFSVYEGEVSNYDLHAVVDTFEDRASSPAFDVDDDSTSLLTAIAYVELDREEERIKSLSCDSCQFRSEYAQECEFQKRSSDTWTHHDWVCPEFESLVYTELVEEAE